MGRPDMLGLFAVLALVAGCAGTTAAKELDPPHSWREMATSADRERIRDWRGAWTTALAQVDASGQSARLAALGPLMLPDSAQPGPALPPGDYSCNVYKLGAKDANAADFTRSPSFTCRVTREKDMLSFAKLDGSQKPVGFLFPADETRMIFLGTMMLGDERRPLDYGRDPERDMAGALERVGPNRWRLVLPFPRWESTLDVVELVPKG
ncbi:DUF4893 domain-containing protein [Sphingomonas sp. KC8]|uniref:DUF4893 domain-containing protein n=2 Tax=Sphingomonas sp. KC8 TaxID=1030157 RepID=UPI000A31BBD1|nr:DUF4893 domain-containing protein [Sphingomonas sp. KC8]ARS27000.1 hypothetical protein KC8_06820 [Sphingomonas sp. KC8]